MGPWSCTRCYPSKAAVERLSRSGCSAAWRPLRLVGTVGGRDFRSAIRCSCKRWRFGGVAVLIRRNVFSFPDPTASKSELSYSENQTLNGRFNIWKECRLDKSTKQARDDEALPQQLRAKAAFRPQLLSKTPAPLRALVRRRALCCCSRTS